MSCAMDGQIASNDIYYSVERLWEPFLGLNCKSFINKPKLFFIQLKQLECKQPSGECTTMNRPKKDSVPRRVVYVIPNAADILLMHSTFTGEQDIVYAFFNYTSVSFLYCRLWGQYGRWLVFHTMPKHGSEKIPPIWQRCWAIGSLDSCQLWGGHRVSNET